MKIFAAFAVMLLPTVCFGSKHAVADELVEIAQDLIVEAVTGVEDLIEDDIKEQADVPVPDTKITKKGRCERYLTYAECKAYANRNGLGFYQDYQTQFAPGCLFKYDFAARATKIYWRKNHKKGNEPECRNDINSLCICYKKRPERKNFCPKLVTGYGTGGSEIDISYQWIDKWTKEKYDITPKACSDACKKRRLTDPTINGITVKYGTYGDLCMCEKGMTTYVQKSSHQTCYLDDSAPQEPMKWYCAVKLHGGVQRKSTNLNTAQKALGFGNKYNIQAIIPMTGTRAGDPHKPAKSWAGGSMWWGGWPDINAMRRLCSKEEPLISDSFSEVLSGRCTSVSDNQCMKIARETFDSNEYLYVQNSEGKAPEGCYYEVSESKKIVTYSYNMDKNAQPCSAVKRCLCSK